MSHAEREKATGRVFVQAYLSREAARRLEQLVASGAFASRTAALEAAVRAFELPRAKRA